MRKVLVVLIIFMLYTVTNSYASNLYISSIVLSIDDRIERLEIIDQMKPISIEIDDNDEKIAAIIELRTDDNKVIDIYSDLFRLKVIPLVGSEIISKGKFVSLNITKQIASFKIEGEIPREKENFAIININNITKIPFVIIAIKNHDKEVITPQFIDEFKEKIEESVIPDDRKYDYRLELERALMLLEANKIDEAKSTVIAALDKLVKEEKAYNNANITISNVKSKLNTVELPEAKIGEFESQLVLAEKALKNGSYEDAINYSETLLKEIEQETTNYKKLKSLLNEIETRNGTINNLPEEYRDEIELLLECTNRNFQKGDYEDAIRCADDLINKLDSISSIEVVLKRYLNAILLVSTLIIGAITLKFVKKRMKNKSVVVPP